MNVTEVVEADFPTVWRYGYPEPDLPPELEFENGSCSTPACGNAIGGTVIDGDYGAPAARWNSAWLLQTSDGAHRYVCEDCADGEDD